MLQHTNEGGVIITTREEASTYCSATNFGIIQRVQPLPLSEHFIPYLTSAEGSKDDEIKSDQDYNNAGRLSKSINQQKYTRWYILRLRQNPRESMPRQSRR